MEIKIISDTLDELQYSTLVPETFKPYTLPAADKVYAGGDYGSIIFQHIHSPVTDIWLSSYFMNREAVFESEGSLPHARITFYLPQ